MLLMLALVPLLIAATKGGSSRSAASNSWTRSAEHAEVVGGDVIAAGPAHVVQRVVGQQAQWPAVERLDREKRDLGIDGPGRLQQIGAVARIHLGLVRFAEGVEQLGARLQQPPPAEHLPRQVDRAPGDPRRLEVVDRATHAVGNAMGHEPLVLGEFLLGLERILPSGTHRRVRMRAGHEHPIRRQPGRLGHLPFGLVQHFAADIDVVADDQRDPRGAVVQDEAPRVQFVVDVLGRRRRAEVAHQPIAQPRGDIAVAAPARNGFSSAAWAVADAARKTIVAKSRNANRYMLVSP